MAGDTGARDENIHSTGSLWNVLAIPVAFVVLVGVVAVVLKGSEVVKEHVPELPLVVDALALAVLGSVLFYAAFRAADLLRG